MKTLMKNSMIILILSILVGCQEKKTNIVTELYPEEQKKLASIVQDIFLTATNKDLARLDAFHLNSPKFTKFEDSDIFTRLNFEEARKAENEMFSAMSDFNYEVQDFKADVFGEVAITTFHFQVNAKMGDTPFVGRLRGTLVFVKVNNDWKITHEHFSLFPQSPQK